MKNISRLFGVGSLLLGAAAGAQAADQPLWELGIGVAGLSAPAYRGSDTQIHYLVPAPYATYRGERFRVNREGLTADVTQLGRAELDLSLSAALPVKSNHVPARVGMDNLHTAVELGPVVKLPFYESRTWGRWTAQWPIRYAIALGGSQIAQGVGWISTPGVVGRGTVNLGRQPLDWTLSANAQFGDKRYHDYYYGVDAAHALSWRPAYEARAGYAGLNFSASLTRRVDNLWFGLFARGSWLDGATFADSPLALRRSNYYAGFGIAWVFANAAEAARGPSGD